MHEMPVFAGGEGGIRTHEALANPPVFKTGEFNRSSTSPQSMQWLVFHSIRPRTPIRCGARRRAGLSAVGFLENRGRNAIAAGLLAAVEGRIGDPEHLLGHPVFTTRHQVHAAEAEARGHLDALLAGLEGGVRDRRPQLAGDVERRFMSGLRHDDGKFLAADPRHPVNPAAQGLLQARAELLQDLVADGVTERIVDLLEVVDVAESQGQGALVTRGPLDLAREVLAEEAPAGSARQFIRRGQLAVLLERNAQYRLELGDAPRRADARVQLAVADPPPD